MRDRKGVDLDGKGREGRGTEEVEREETINCVYYMRKNIFFFFLYPLQEKIFSIKETKLKKNNSNNFHVKCGGGKCQQIKYDLDMKPFTTKVTMQKLGPQLSVLLGGSYTRITQISHPANS